MAQAINNDNTDLGGNPAMNDDDINWDGDPDDFSYGKMIDKYNELKEAHDNLAMQLSTTNDLLEIAVEGLEYYARNDNKFVNWKAKKILAKICGDSVELIRKSTPTIE